MKFKNKLMFYQYTKEMNKKFKNEKVYKQNIKFEDLITQKRYVEEILSIIHRHKTHLNRLNKEIIFQKNNNENHDIKIMNNCYR